jgi:hypothetical protein
MDIECIALMRTDKAKSGYTLEYLFFDGFGKIRPESLKQGLSDRTEKIFLFYRNNGPIMAYDYNACKALVENGTFKPEEAYELLS